MPLFVEQIFESHRIKGAIDVRVHAWIGDKGDIRAGVQQLDTTCRCDRLLQVVLRCRNLRAVREEKNSLETNEVVGNTITRRCALPGLQWVRGKLPHWFVRLNG